MTNSAKGKKNYWTIEFDPASFNLISKHLSVLVQQFANEITQAYQLNDLHEITFDDHRSTQIIIKEKDKKKHQDQKLQTGQNMQYSSKYVQVIFNEIDSFLFSFSSTNHV